MKDKTKKIILVIDTILVMLLALSFIYAVYSSGDFHHRFSNGVVGVFMDAKVIGETRNTIVVSLADLCSNFDTDSKRIECVYNFVEDNYHYDYDRIDVDDSFYIPQERLINFGGVCRDYALFYASVFKRMGYDYSFIFESNHVYINIYTDTETYLIDQTFIGSRLDNQRFVRSKLIREYFYE